MAEPCTNDDASHSLAESLRGLALDDPERDKRLMQIGYAQLDLYDTESSNPDHLLKAIALFREALVLRPVGHAYRSAALNILGVTLHMRFDRTGDMADLQEAITCHAEARQIRKPNNAARPDSCSNLGLAYHALFSQTGDRDALQKSIEMHREAFDLSSPQDPSHGNHRGNLATALMTRYNQDEDMPTLREVIDLHRQTLQLYEPGDPRSAYSMQNLAVALEALYVHDADLSTAEEAIRLYREALVFVPPGHPNRAGLLTTLSAALGSLFEQTGDLSALEEALEPSREALRLAPEHSPGRLACLNNAALLALTLFRRTGRVNALDETIELNRTVLASRPSGHPKRSSTLDVLAVALTFRFQVTGGLAALAESIQLLRENVQTCPPAMRDAALHSLAGALLIRYAEDPEADDIEEIVRLNRETLLLRPAGSLLHPYSLHSLADALRRRYSQNGDPKDMQEAIALLQQALSLRPAAHPERPLVLDQLAMTSRQIINASADDLRRAIALYEEALQLLPDDHTDRAAYFSSLGETLLELFEKTDDLEVLNSAIAQLQLAASLRVPGHPQYVDCLLKLVKALAARLQVQSSAGSAMQMQTIDSADWDRCLRLLSVAAVDESVSAGHRVQQATRSLSVLDRCLAVITREEDAEAIRLLDVMLAYVRLLPRVANFGLTRSKRLRALSRAGTLTRMTAAVALVLGQTQVTLEVLEEGRGVFWTQALLLRSRVLDELPDTDRSKLEEIFTALEKEPAPSRQGMIADAADETVVTERQAERRRELNEMAEALLRSIRARPRFQRFFMPPAFIQLVRAAQQGPVVVLLVTDRDGSALIIPGFSAEPKVVSLPLLKPNELQSIRADVPEGRLLEPVETGDDEPTRLQLGRSKKMGKFEQALSRLWVGVVRPIVDALELQVIIAF
jgi:tetratricopeptide (TPR) repeat protein